MPEKKVPSSSLLNSDDRCRRLPFLSAQWEPSAISPMEALYSAVESGLTDTSDREPSDVAEDALMELATSRGLDSNQVDILGEASHLASLASMIAFLLRPQGPWKRPEPFRMADGSYWTPGSFLDPMETHLRRVVLVGRWDVYRQVQEEHDWRTMEAAIYRVPMDLVVVVLGQQRDGRRHGPLSRGYMHPVAKNLRFRKRDGGGFDGAWEPVFREKARFSKEEWLDAMVDDGVLQDVVMIHTVPVPDNAEQLCNIAMRKLERIKNTEKISEPQISQCFSRTHPCIFRGCCPSGSLPSMDNGFIKINI